MSPRVVRMSSRLSCGRDFHCSPDINTSIETACKAGFEFLCLPLVNPRYKREFIESPAKNRAGALTRSDLLLTSQDWSTLVVGKVSPWLQVDSRIDHTRKNSERAFKQEISYAAHLSMPAILVPVRDRHFTNTARILNEHLMSGFVHQQIWIQVPLFSAKDQCQSLIEGSTDGQEDGRYEDTWEWWHKFHTMCDCYKKMGVALELTADLPSEEVLQRWLAEPVKCVILSTSLFLTNKKGYPVLSRAHQAYLRRLFKLDIQIILTGVDRHPDKGIRSYQQYLDHLFQTQPPPDTVSQFARGYEDYLQCPLQPLMDNLESQTYEIFEKDPVKYSQYQKAIYYALLERVPAGEKETREIVLTVVGAGRGPLVRAAIAAAQQADRKVHVYAVEKNPNAVITLESLKDEMWGEQVTVVSCDMREWDAPEKTDILISELLGSFGDNELSPECLDGAQRFLKDDGISIPQDYTSYLVPIQSTKLYNEVRMCKEKDKHPDAMFEMPYVVRLHNCQILAEPKEVFSFHHPNRDPASDNSRFASLEFRMENNAVLHGFAGYFETTLFNDIKLSILPSTHSPGMFSWFPILFPIKQPSYVSKGHRVVLDIWRLCTPKNIWYEWCLLEPQVLPIHNPKGRSYTIGL